MNITNKAILDDLRTTESTPKTDLGYSIDSLQEDKFKRKKVIFKNQNQAKAYSILEAIAKRHKWKYLMDIIDLNLDYNVSVGGRGREDIVTVSKFRGETQHNWTEKILSFAGRR